MQPFDKKYWERRENQLKEMYILRGLSTVFGAVAIVCALIAVVLALFGTGWVIFPGIFGGVAGFVSGILRAIYFAQEAASKAVQEEYEHMLRVMGEKPKRNASSGSVRLSDDGELIDEDDEDNIDTRVLRKSRTR